MKTDEPTYIAFTPIELWRLGVKNSARLDKIRVPPRPPGATVDVQTYERGGHVFVRAGTGGVSLFDGKNPRLDGIHWWRIPRNSPIPPELKITKNHLDRSTGLTHYRVELIVDMPLQLFVRLLSVFAGSAERSFVVESEREVAK